MFRACDGAGIEIDLLPHLDDDLERFLANHVHPDVPTILCGARTGEGLDAWVLWLRDAVCMREMEA